MFDTKKVSLTWAGRKLTLETGRIARQATGSVLATYGETTVLATVVAAPSAKPGIDFFPLTVNYQEKYYAAGRIPGGFFKREARPTERETLISRLIDRPIRPLFPKGFKNETQVVVTVLSYDLENDPDVVAFVAASAALTLSGLPFLGPIGGARVAEIDGKLVLNPLVQDMKESKLDLMIVGTSDAIMMIESEASELSEARMLEALMFGHKNFQPVIEAIIKLAEVAAKDPWPFTPEDKEPYVAKVTGLIGSDLRSAYNIVEKTPRREALSVAKDKAKKALVLSEANPDGMSEQLFGESFKAAEAEIVRNAIVKEGKRIDGRGLDVVRPIVVETQTLPRAHGSALFTRGETQALVVATLGTADDEQMIDGLEGLHKDRFMMHYNMPPYAVGEVGRMMGPGRREIGHGNLAKRALKAVLPKTEDFPYTIRLVSEITESNGSSSMASVCGGSLALMDAGAPILAPVAGVAMGLVKQGDEFAVLTDILGDEDFLGDMDFKVAGTEHGITALQMDIKITGITEEIMRTALEQAHRGRIHILGEMNKAMGTARGEIGAYAPKIVQIKIPTDKIRDVIGTGGKVIREIVEKTKAKVDIQDDGTVKVASSNQEAIDAAIKWIKSLTSEPEVGAIYDGKIVKVMEFGAFVNFFGAKDGLVHISEMAPHRVKATSDVVKEGQMVKVKLLGFDDRGKVRLSMKLVDQVTGEPIAPQPKEQAGE
ncbi:MAG: polyribonucleotide nucleotidyltransferase [Caulobacterales bacterium]